ncbi:mucoidy inhibitor MuiA family protein [Testudinibacter sp. P27/CKL/0425]
MQKTVLTSLAVATALCSAQSLAAIEKIDSSIEQVTLYQHLAKVERRAEVHLNPGTHELQFANLPLSLEESSLQFSAEGNRGLTVLSIDSEVRSARQHSASLLRELQQEISAQQSELQKIADQLAMLENQFSLLQTLQHGRLNGQSAVQSVSFEDFSQLQKFSRTTYAELTGEKSWLVSRQQDEQRKLEQLQQEYQRLGGDQGLMQRVVRVQVQAADSGKQTLKLAYNTVNASWQPQYQLDYNSENNQLSLQYAASIRQNSNEDWQNVKLILSSANPIQVGEAPQVEPWLIDFYQPYNLQQPRAVAMQHKSAVAAMDGAEVLELAAPQPMMIESGTIASQFEISGTVNLLSSNSAQNVVIAQTAQPVSAEYAFYPGYQQKVLLTVSGKNQQDYPLLGGSLRTSYDGQVIGSGYLPTLLPGEEFKQLIGEDQTISVQAEPLKRNEENSGLINKSKVVRISSGYTLQNNRPQAVEVVVYDRIPQSVQQKLVVTVSEPNLKNVTLDDNGRYQQKITLAPNSKQRVEKAFSLQYPQDKQLEGL